ncbi:MAG TPA: Clp protease N-terminal domain-containing protein [Acidimicrobiales bacterium]|nr:Clp protease N-terminal domain-containing protein [Acidimicrobiales bacterium]
MAPTPSLQDVIHLVEADTEDQQPLSRLGVASVLVRNLAEVGDAALGYFVDQARHAGHSWSEIGEALGVSKQAAQQKHTVRLSLGLNTPTFERFTPRARNVLSEAEPIARQWGHRQIATEHLLLALYREPEGVAAQILNESNLPVDKAETAVDARTKRGPGAPKEKLSFSPEAIAAFTGALASALEMGHNYIGTEHLLLGLARGDGQAADILEDAGLRQETLERQVTEKLAGYTQVRRPVKRVTSSTVAKIARAKPGPASKRKPR